MKPMWLRNTALGVDLTFRSLEIRLVEKSCGKFTVLETIRENIDSSRNAVDRVMEMLDQFPAWIPVVPVVPGMFQSTVDELEPVNASIPAETGLWTGSGKWFPLEDPAGVYLLKFSGQTEANPLKIVYETSRFKDLIESLNNRKRICPGGVLPGIAQWQVNLDSGNHVNDGFLMDWRFGIVRLAGIADGVLVYVRTVLCEEGWQVDGLLKLAADSICRRFPGWKCSGIIVTGDRLEGLKEVQGFNFSESGSGLAEGAAASYLSSHTGNLVRMPKPVRHTQVLAPGWVGTGILVSILAVLILWNGKIENNRTGQWKESAGQIQKERNWIKNIQELGISGPSVAGAGKTLSDAVSMIDLPVSISPGNEIRQIIMKYGRIRIKSVSSDLESVQTLSNNLQKSFGESITVRIASTNRTNDKIESDILVEVKGSHESGE